MLQTRSKRTISQVALGDLPPKALFRKNVSMLASGPKNVSMLAYPGLASQLLPPELLQLGIQIMGSEALLDNFVANTRQEQINYAGVVVTLRMVNDDHSDGTMTDEGGPEGLYKLEALDAIRLRPPEMAGINMIDLGGNYGIVSIAAYMKYPYLLRSIIVEPISTTFFMLRWNMHLNGVPAISQEDLALPNPPTGLIVLNAGVVNAVGQTMQFCYTPPYTMNAFKCQCDQLPDYQCSTVQGVTMRSLADMFGNHPITLAKVDCEGCEVVSLPDIHKMIQESPGRIRRLVGELHTPSREIEDIACMFDMGQFFVRICQTGPEQIDAIPLSCAEPKNVCQGGNGFPDYSSLAQKANVQKFNSLSQVAVAGLPLAWSEVYEAEYGAHTTK